MVDFNGKMNEPVMIRQQKSLLLDPSSLVTNFFLLLTQEGSHVVFKPAFVEMLKLMLKEEWNLSWNLLDRQWVDAFGTVRMEDFQTVVTGIRNVVDADHFTDVVYTPAGYDGHENVRAVGQAFQDALGFVGYQRQIRMRCQWRQSTVVVQEKRQFFRVTHVLGQVLVIVIHGGRKHSADLDFRLDGPHQCAIHRFKERLGPGVDIVDPVKAIN